MNSDNGEAEVTAGTDPAVCSDPKHASWSGQNPNGSKFKPEGNWEGNGGKRFPQDQEKVKYQVKEKGSSLQISVT